MSDSPTTCIETIYNAVLKRNDAYSKLSELVTAADKFNTKETNVDVIQEYLVLSRNCQEIIDVIRNLPNTSAKDAAILFDVVTYILIRTANDLKHFNTVGSSFVTAVLTFGVHTIYNFLKPQQKPSRMRTTLRLLSALVAQGPQAARDVFVKVNLPNANFAHLLQKSNHSTEDDIRTSFLNLVVLLLTVGDNVLIRQILETKGFLNSLFPGFVHDRPATVMLILNTFYEKIVNNSTIGKTSKVRLFNDYTLKFIVQLYEWKGTVRVRKAAKRKLGEGDAVQIMEASNNTIEAVRLTAHKFMMGVCCSYKNGIVFRDTSYGFSGRNQNHIITNVLASISHPYSNPLLFELVVSVLKTCPDQLKYYLPCLADSLFPRLSVPWMQAVQLLKEIILSINYCSCLFETGEKKAVSKLAFIARQLCIPEVMTISHFSDSFKDGHPIVCSHLLDYLHCVLKCVDELLAYCKVPGKNSMYSVQELSEFSHAFVPLVKKSLPEFALIERYWGRLINADLIVEEEDKSIADKSFSFPSQIYQILEVLKIYMNMFQGVCQDVGVFVQIIFNGLKEILPEIKDDSLQLEIIDVVSTFIPAETYVTMQKESFSPLIMVLDLYLATEDPKKMTRIKFIIFKLLSNVCIFHEYPWELDLWLKYIKTSNEENHKNLHNFFVETLMYFVKQEVQALSKRKKESKFKFSSLVPVALQRLDSSEANRDFCSTYVESVLKHFVHRHLEPKSVLALIENCNSSFSENIMRYLWLLSNSKDRYNCKDIELYVENPPAACNEAFQNIFIASRFGIDTKKLRSHFKKLFKKQQNEDFTEIESLLWQSLTYINLEASFLWDTSHAANKTEIQFYASVLEDLIALSQNADNEKHFFNYEVDEKELTFPLRSFRYSVVEAILCHPAITKYFLFLPDNFISEQTMKPFLAITNLVLHLLKNYCSNQNSCDEKLLIPIKVKAINFCEAFFTRLYMNDALCSSFWNVVETLVTQFPFMFSCQNVISFIDHYLSLHKEHFQMFDPKLIVLGQLLDVYCGDEEYLLLSPSCVRALLCKFLSLKEKKRKRFTEKSISKLFKKHPVYTLALKSGDAPNYFKRHSFSDLELRGDLITHNVAFRDGVSIQQMLNNLGNDDACNEDEYTLHLVAKFCDQNSISSKKEIITFLKSIANDYWRCLSKVIVDVNSDDLHLPTSNICSLIALLRDEHIIGETHMNNLVEELLQMSKSKQVIPLPNKMQLLLEIFSGWEDFWSKSLLELILNLLQTNLSAVHSSALNESLVKFSLNLVKNSESHCVQGYFKGSSNWLNFLQATLKEAFKNMNCSDVLLNVLSCICEKLSTVTGSKTVLKMKEKTKVIHDLITSHSNFFPVMLNENNQYHQLKGSILSLMTNLLKANGELCKDTHVPLLLASYNGTLSCNDQKLLLLLKLYEDEGISMAQFSPFIWSSAAIAHYSVNKNVKYVLWRQPVIQEVLNLFNKEMLNFTAVNFPLGLKHEMQVVENQELKSQGEKIYDPRFVLPLISGLLAPGSYVNCRDFIESGALGVLFRSLSSQDSDMRALGYYCLTQFYTHLQQPNSKQCQMWIALLDSIRYSIESSNFRIPSIVTLFLAKAVNIIIKPDNHMYTAVYKFLTVKPNLDLMQVPEFYKLFNSIEIEHRIQRSWILSLIGEGLQSSLDFHLCQKRYLFTILLPYYNSALSTETEKVKILQIILACVKIYSSARSLCQAGLLTWLDNIIKNSDIKDNSILMPLNDIMIELWHVSYQNYVDVESTSTNCSLNEKEDHCSESNVSENPIESSNDNSTRGKFMYSSFCSEFLLVSLGFIPKLVLLDVVGLCKYLQTLADILKFTGSGNYTEKLSVNNSSLTFHHISLLVEQWQTFHDLHYTTGHKSSVSHNDADVTSLTTDDEESYKMQQNFFEIVMFWTPPLKQLTLKNQYDAVVSTCVTIVNLTFNCLLINPSSITRLSEWLLCCMDNDSKQGINKLLLSPNDRSRYCVKTILYLYERVAMYSVGKCEDVSDQIVRQLAALSSVCSYLKQSETVNQELLTLQSILANKLT